MNITLGTGDQDFAIRRGVAQNDTVTDFKSIHFTASLDGNQEVPGRVIAAAGTALGVLNLDQTQFVFTVTTSNIDVDGLQTPGDALDNKTDLHIHQGAVGVGGGIVYDDDQDTSFAANGPAGIMAGVWDAAQNFSGANVAALLADATYFNVHTTEFGGGPAIRGQILKADNGLDRIDLTAFNIGSLAALQLIMSETAGSAVIRGVYNGIVSKVTLDGADIAQLAASDFVFAGAVDETITGTSKADDLFGAGGVDTLNGSGGNDHLFGEDGNDRVSGGDGNDRLLGGAGLDRLAGGLGRDIFDFNAITESTVAVAGRDLITDFNETATDRIDLSTIDANSVLGGNNAFSFIGTAAFTGLGQIRAFASGANTIVDINTTGSTAPDMRIFLTGLHVLDAADFVL